MHIPVTERWPPQLRTCVKRAKLFSELKLVTDNLLSIYQWEQLIIASHIVKRSNIGDTKGLGRAAVPIG